VSENQRKSKRRVYLETQEEIETRQRNAKIRAVCKAVLMAYDHCDDEAIEAAKELLVALPPDEPAEPQKP